MDEDDGHDNPFKDTDGRLSAARDFVAGYALGAQGDGLDLPHEVRRMMAIAYVAGWDAALSARRCQRNSLMSPSCNLEMSPFGACASA